MGKFQVLVKVAGAPRTLALSVESSETATDVLKRYADAMGVCPDFSKHVSMRSSITHALEASPSAIQFFSAPPAHSLAPLTQRLVHCGRTLPAMCSLDAAALPPCALLEVLPRLCGGGGDGGSTGAESRSAYLEMYRGKQHDKVNPEEERLARWTACHLSGMPLAPPCAADELGNLYNKESVVQALLTKSIPRSMSHISSIKHLIDVKLTAADGAAADAAVRFACPVTGLPMSGKSKFVIVRPGGTGAGHIFSEKALKELPAVVEETVGGKWAPSDLIPVYPQGEELEARQTVVMARMEAEAAAKAEKKAAKAAAKGNKRAAAAAGENGGEKAPEPAKKAKTVTAAELMPEGADPKVWNSLFTSSKAKEETANGKGKNNDYMVRGTMKYVA